MRDRFKVIDADRHVLEPSDLFANYLPAQFRDHVPSRAPTSRGVPLTVNRFPTRTRCGRERSRKTTGSPLVLKGWRETFADALAAKFDAASNVRDMDREGVDVSVLFPTHWSVHHVAQQPRPGTQRGHLPWHSFPGSPTIVATTLNVSTVSPSFRCRIRNGPWRAKACQREAWIGGHLLAAQQVMRPYSFEPRLFSGL
jgi:hypothetical protein